MLVREDWSGAGGNGPGGRKRPRLFEVFPALEGRVAWRPLIQGPTPVQPLEKLSRHLGREVWIKRDDLTSPEYGGNKPRKLEFLLAEARAGGKRLLVTGGGLGTNHGLATAFYGRRLGFQVELDLFAQPVTEHVRRNLKLFHVLRARMRFCGGLGGFVLRHYLTGPLLRRGAYFIPPGGSSPVGTLGYVDAGLELAGQVKRGEMPEPEAVFAAVGTCGTMAGLLIGLRLGGLGSRVIGVRVATPLSAHAGAITGLADRTLGLLRRLDPSLPELDVSEAPLVTDQYGPGYGHPTPAGREAARLAADLEGIRLDLTYTAKTLAALQAYAAAGPGRGPLLFWHTFSAADLAPLAEGVDHRDLPRAFHRFFEPGK
ncbi:MAG: pyridoxal-phosphate dependent enzyme [Thermodesulfobacteriota bacterium]